MAIPRHFQIAVLLLFSAFQPSFAEESIPINRERMQMLIEGLAQPDSTSREKAFKELQGLGEICWPSIASYENEDSERGRLVKLLGRDCAMVLPSDAATAETARTKLENHKDPDLRAEGFEGLMLIGSAGHRLLQKHLSGESADLRYALKPQTPVQVGNGKVTTSVALVNHGKGVAWCQAGILTPRMYLSKLETYGQRRPGPIATRGVVGNRKLFHAPTAERHPIKDWFPILPGAAIVCKDFEVEVSGVGIHILNAFGQVPEPAEIKVRSKNSDAFIPFVIGSQLNPGSRYVHSKVNVFVLPNIESYPEASEGVTLSARKKLKSVGDREIRAEVTVQIESKAKEALVWVEEDLAKYAYYILLNDGEPVIWGSWHSVLSVEKDTELALKAQTLRPNQSAHWELLITRPVEPGRYKLLLVYEKPPTLQSGPALGKEYLEQLPFQVMTVLDDVFSSE